jgi:hypothetical protein
MIPLIGGIFLIFSKHFKTLNEDANKLYQILNFFLIPIVVAILFVGYGKLLTSSSANTLITAFSIFTGLLLNIILIIFAIIDGKPSSDRKQGRLLDHLYANSIYALLVSAIILVILIISIIWDNWLCSSFLIGLSLLIYFGITHFIMTLLMIFTRLYVLLFDTKIV